LNAGQLVADAEKTSEFWGLSNAFVDVDVSPLFPKKMCAWLCDPVVPFATGSKVSTKLASDIWHSIWKSPTVSGFVTATASDAMFTVSSPDVQMSTNAITGRKNLIATSGASR